jgi:hypothetical protein
MYAREPAAWPTFQPLCRSCGCVRLAPRPSTKRRIDTWRGCRRDRVERVAASCDRVGQDRDSSLSACVELVVDLFANSGIAAAAERGSHRSVAEIGGCFDDVGSRSGEGSRSVVE